LPTSQVADSRAHLYLALGLVSAAFPGRRAEGVRNVWRPSPAHAEHKHRGLTADRAADFWGIGGDQPRTGGPFAMPFNDLHLVVAFGIIRLCAFRHPSNQGRSDGRKFWEWLSSLQFPREHHWSRTGEKTFGFSPRFSFSSFVQLGGTRSRSTIGWGTPSTGRAWSTFSRPLIPASTRPQHDARHVADLFRVLDRLGFHNGFGA